MFYVECPNQKYQARLKFASVSILATENLNPRQSWRSRRSVKVYRKKVGFSSVNKTTAWIASRIHSLYIYRGPVFCIQPQRSADYKFAKLFMSSPQNISGFSSPIYIVPVNVPSTNRRENSAFDSQILIIDLHSKHKTPAFAKMNLPLGQYQTNPILNIYKLQV